MPSALMAPLDGSELALCSLPLGAHMAARTGARLDLVLVCEADAGSGDSTSLADGGDEPVGTEPGGDAPDTGRHRREIDYVGELADRLERERGCTVEPVVLDGPVVDSLIEHARRAGVEMVFMTTHGRSGLSRILLGSVADELVRSSTLPTVLVHPDCHPLGLSGEVVLDHILVPLDGSDVAESVLGAASELATALEARITLTDVVSIDSFFGPRPLKLLRFHQDVTGARAYLESVARRLSDEGHSVDIHPTHGRSPAVTIAQIAQELDADLIAVGTRGLKGLRRTLRGSVAHRLLHVAHRPLLVMNGGAAT
jgi:nucleotide-binding universal stress UspA family protein